MTMDRQLTFDVHGHILTNIGCWSHDGRWIVYDTRSDAAGSVFDGTRIERVHVDTGRVESLYESPRGAHCGVVTCCPVSERVVFILGPEPENDDWPYSAYHRRGVLLSPDATPLDAMCYSEPFVPGALRGGSHVHTFDSSGQLVAFTYEDHVLATAPANSGAERNQRNIGVSTPLGDVQVHAGHPRNHSGSHFSVLLTTTHDQPRPGSDEICRAVEDAWVGRAGYRPLRSSDILQKAIAFFGEVIADDGDKVVELFLVDLPADLTRPGHAGPLAGTALSRPRSPAGTRQRRLTYTTKDFPTAGVCGPRHWPRSLPDGSRIFFLMRDENGAAQFWSITPKGEQLQQLTHLEGVGVTSAFSVSADGAWLAHTAGGSVCATSTTSGQTRRLTEPRPQPFDPRPEACVFAPQGHRIAYVRPVHRAGATWNQICVVDVELE